MMPEPLKVAVVGIGRMGVIHALHVHELEQEGGHCALAALVDVNTEHASRLAADIGRDVPVFASIDDLIRAGVCNASVIVTPTDNHLEHAARLILAGHRVLLEKPLTGALES